jgi:hypothetical protein
MSSLRIAAVGLGLGWLLLGWTGVAVADGADPGDEHEAAARAATLAWWLGVQEYPHAVLDTVDATRAGQVRTVRRQSLRAIVQALDTSGGDPVLVAFNPHSHPCPGAHRGVELPGADRHPIVIGPGDRAVGQESGPAPAAGEGIVLAFAVDPPPIGVAVYRVRERGAGEVPAPLGAVDDRHATADSLVQVWRRERSRAVPATVLPVEDPAPGPWGRAISLVKLGTRAGPGHPRVDVVRLRKRPGADQIVVTLANRSAGPADHVIVAPIAPIRAWQELGPDGSQIVAGADVDLQGGALLCDLAAGAERSFALELAPPPPVRRFGAKGD